jgi:hypothetical protein
VFDFSTNKWEKELDCLPGQKEQGQIPEELAENFLAKVWTVCNLPETVYQTGSKRYVPANEEERYILQSDTKRLTWFRSLILDKIFEWIAETDTKEPYSVLTAAYTELLTGLDI